ncbi:Oidioi.mRNA.OKI2018_I69.PAR.g9944.t1.cds [Oikopleura dioica]|uniref:Hexosyltransferase n=1 Tax=Oikopleura dioica TaxID=34765 RepID=A0ABN7RRM9_OIKDI|nr:Oidioi.mRNA.OKI2018_I69.PAR.g9944.t1.cds [Oikopleura dioica]
MNISLTFQSDDIPPIYKFDMKQEFNGFLKYPVEFVEKYQCDQIGNKALYMLKTARNAVEERFRIRRYFRQNGLAIKNYIFFLGTSPSGQPWEEGDFLEDEFNKFNDIVIADFPDTYNNLPLKTKSLYEFALRFCSEKISQYYFHDSDTLIHGDIEKLVRNSMREEEMDENYNRACNDLEDDDQRFGLGNLKSCYHRPMTEEEPMIMCLRHTGRNHGAIYWGKYNVTYEMFPPKYKYPDYCNGQCAVMNRKSLEAIGEQVGKTYLGDFRIEDIYFTGILREKAGVNNLQDFTRTISEFTSTSGYQKSVKTKTCMHYSKEMIMTPKAHLINDRFYPEMPTGIVTQKMFEERKEYFKRMHREKLRETKEKEHEEKERKKLEEDQAKILKERNLEVAGIAPQNKGFHPINWLSHHFVRKY